METPLRSSGTPGLAVLLLVFLAMAAGLAVVWMGLFKTEGAPVVQLNETVHESGSSHEPGPQPLRVAVAAMISPETTRRYYDELLRLIGERMGKPVEFLQRRTYAEVNDLVRHNDVDVAFVCAGPYIEGHTAFGMEIIAVPVVKGEKVYYSYIIVSNDSPINSFEQLRGKRFAFTDPDSNTGCLVPRYMLAKMGETPESFFSETFYTHSHDNSIKAVANGQADGAAVDSLIYEFIKTNEPELTRHTKIVFKSPPYGIPPIVVNPGIDEKTKERLKEVFLSLNKDKAALPLLKRIGVERFDTASDSDYDEVRRMQDWLAHRK